MVNVGVLIDVHLLSETSNNLTSRDILTTSQFKLTKHVEPSWVVVFKDLLLPTVDRNLRLDNVGEVLIEEGVLDLLNNLGRFTDVIDESTRSLGQSINVQHTLSNVDVIDQTRCARDNTLHLTTNNKVTTGVSNFKDLRLNLPTFILGYNTESTSKFVRLTLEEFFTFQEARGLNHCFCFTTEHLGE